MKQTFAIEADINDLLSNLSYHKHRAKGTLVNAALAYYLQYFPHSYQAIPEDE